MPRLAQIESSAPVDTSAVWAPAAPRPAHASEARVTLSEHAQMLLQLQSIADSHPPSASLLLSDLAAKMRIESARPGHEFMGRIAEKVQHSVETGDLRALASLGEAPLGDAPAGPRSSAAAAYLRVMNTATVGKAPRQALPEGV